MCVEVWYNSNKITIAHQQGHPPPSLCFVCSSWSGRIISVSSGDECSALSSFNRIYTCCEEGEREGKERREEREGRREERGEERGEGRRRGEEKGGEGRGGEGEDIRVLS